MGIDKVYYSVEGGSIACEKVKSMEPGHVCAGTQFLQTGIDRTQRCKVQPTGSQQALSPYKKMGRPHLKKG